MVSRWAHQREAVGHLTRQHCLHRAEEPPRGHQRRVEGAGGDVGVGVEVAPARLGHALHPFDVRCRVHLFQFLSRRRAGLHGGQTAQHPRLLQRAEDLLQAAGVLRMGGQVVLEIYRIVDVGCFHGLLRFCSRSQL